MEPSAFASSIRAHTNPRSSNRIGAERDAWILRLSQIGPVWTNALLGIGLFRTRQIAERRLTKLEDSGRLRYAGRVSIDGGKKTHVWCNRRFWERMLRHETDVMRVFLAFWPHAYALTGPHVAERWKADLELTIGSVASGRKYMVEVDEGSEPLSQVRCRLSAYGDCPHAVLFVAPTASRAREVVKLTGNPHVYVSTIERCVVDPWGNHWRNCLGEPGRVANPGAQGSAFPGANDGAKGAAFPGAEDGANAEPCGTTDPYSGRARTEVDRGKPDRTC